VHYLSPARDAPVPTETAVIVPVPDAEPIVADHRERLDTAADRGVPAHVTVLYPFVAPAAVDEHVLATLGAAVGSVEAFDCRFARTRWFGDEVLWLDPEPAEPFRRLTAAVRRAFPQHPPYGGVHDDVVPHLTVAEKRRGGTAAAHAAEQAVAARLPLSTPDHLGAAHRRLRCPELLACAPRAAPGRCRHPGCCDRISA
jgi:2'-5' RNA ligase